MLWLLALVAALGIVVARRSRESGRDWRLAGWSLTAASLAAAAVLAPPVVVLRKLVGFLLMPTTVVWIVLAFLCVRAWREPRWRWRLISTLVLYSAAGSPITSYVLTRSLERPFESVFPLAETVRYDAVLVMGGGSAARPDHDEDGAPQLGQSGDRLRVAAALHLQGRAPIVVSSGSTVDRRRDVSAETASLLQEMGIPPAALLRLPDPLNSAAEIAAYTTLVAERGWTKVGLITSARHLPRALALCRQHRLVVDPLPSDFRAEPPTWDPSAIVPSGTGFAAVQETVWEYVGIAAVYVFKS